MNPLNHLFSFMLASIALLNLNYTQASQNHGFKAKLINRDSRNSPFYKPNVTDADRLSLWTKRSNDRIQYFETLSSTETPEAIKSIISPSNGEYLMKFAIGTPPADITANFDTGSAMTWIQCLPCNPCFGQKDAIFDPSKSSSIKNVPCDSNECAKAEVTTCENETCTYMLRYGDGSTTKGSVNTDKFAFPTMSGNIAIIPDVVFGCGHQNAGVYIEEQQGIIGFSMSPKSFIGNIGYKKFSYCLSTYSFTDSGSYLRVGPDAQLSGRATIIAEEYAPIYYVNLDDITVGNIRLHLEFGYLRRTPAGGVGTIMDTGTAVTRLRDKAYVNVTNELINQIKLERSPNEKYLCYKGTRDDLQKNLPSLIFHFEDLNVPIPQESAFREVTPGVICFMMLPSDGLSIIGSFVQQNLNVGIDLENFKIYMSPQECANL